MVEQLRKVVVVEVVGVVGVVDVHQLLGHLPVVRIKQLEQKLTTMASLQHRSHSGGEASTSYGGYDFCYMASVVEIEASVAVTRGVTQASEPRGATMELDPQRGEAGRQATLP